MERFTLAPFTKADLRVMVVGTTPEYGQLQQQLPAGLRAPMEQLVAAQRLFLAQSLLFRSPAFRDQSAELCRMYEGCEERWLELYRRLRSYSLVRRFLAEDAHVEVLQAACQAAQRVDAAIDRFTTAAQVAYPRLGFLLRDGVIAVLTSLGGGAGAGAGAGAAVQPLYDVFDFARLVFDRMNNHEALAVRLVTRRLEFSTPLVYYDGSIPEFLQKLESETRGLIKEEVRRLCLRHLQNYAAPTRFTLNDLLALPPQVAEVFLRLQFTMAIENAIDQRTGFGLAQSHQRLLLEELHHVTGDMGHHHFSPEVQCVVRRLLSVQYQHCATIDALSDANVEISSDPRWFGQLRYYYSTVRRTVMVTFEGHDVEYGYELNDWTRLPSLQGLYDPAIARLLFTAHQTLQIVRLASGPPLPTPGGSEEPPSLAPPLDIAIDTLLAMAIKVFTLDCLLVPREVLGRAIDAAFDSGVALVLRRFGQAAADVRDTIESLFRARAGPLARSSETARPWVIVECNPSGADPRPRSPALARLRLRSPTAARRPMSPDLPSEGSMSSLTDSISLRPSTAEGAAATDAALLPATTNSFVSVLAPHLMCLGFSPDGAAEGVKRLSRAQAFLSHQLGPARRRVYGDFGMAFLRGVCAIAGYLYLEEPSIRLSEEGCIGLALHMALMPRLTAEERSGSGTEFFATEFPGTDFGTAYSHTFRCVSQAIDRCVRGMALPVLRAAIPLEKQDEGFAAGELRRRDDYYFTLQATALAMLLFPLAAHDRCPPFAALVVLGPRRAGKASAVQILSTLLREVTGPGSAYHTQATGGPALPFAAARRATADAQAAADDAEDTLHVTLSGASPGELLGSFVEVSGQWVDGALTRAVSAAAQRAAAGRHVLLVLRGAVPPEVLPFVLLLLGDASVTVPPWAATTLAPRYHQATVAAPARSHQAAPLSAASPQSKRSPFLHILLLQTEADAQKLTPSGLNHCFILNLTGLRGAE